MRNKVNIQYIAKELGISKSTVSRALSGKGRIGTDTRNKVVEYANKLNYQPNQIARLFSEKKTNNIGVVLPADEAMIDMPFFQTCLIGISHELVKTDRDVVVITSSKDDISNLKRVVRNGKVDGVILTRVLQNDIQVRYLQENGIPFVSVGYINDNSVPYIDFNNFGATKELMSKVIKSKKIKVAFLIGDTTFLVNKSRLSAVLETSANIDIEVYTNILINTQVEEILDDILSKKNDMIICGDDYICNALLQGLSHRNIKIPQDIKIVSLYNSKALENHIPAITSVNYDIIDIGHKVAQKMIDILVSSNSDSLVIDSYEIIITESIGEQ